MKDLRVSTSTCSNQGIVRTAANGEDAAGVSSTAKGDEKDVVELVLFWCFRKARMRYLTRALLGDGIIDAAFSTSNLLSSAGSMELMSKK